MDSVPRRYRSYLLRLRRVQGEGQPVWRYSLITPGSEARHDFNSLIELMTYLAWLTDDPLPLDPGEPQAPK